MRPNLARWLAIAIGWTAVAAMSCPAQSRPTAFVDVNVVDVVGERVVQAQTVLVRGGKIAWIGPAAEAKLAKGTIQVPGEGGYLLPGFADMHAHPGREADLLTFVANGITTIRVMWGDEEQLRWRGRIAMGRLLGPRIVTAGAIIDGDPPSQPSMKVITDAHLARAEVVKQQKAGFDFIKVYNSVPAAVYDTIVAVARELEMPVAGHVPFAVGLDGALRARQASIEHLRGYVAELVPKDAPVQPGPTLRSRSVVWNYIDASRIPALAARTKEAGVWNVPTAMVAFDMLPAAEYAALLQRADVKYMVGDQVPDRSKINYLADFADSDYVATQRGVVRQLEMITGLYRGGARLLLGTDSWLQGFAFKEELANFARAGIPLPDILRMATRDAAEFLGEQREWGEVAVGQRADLQLLRGNPLESLEALNDRLGVMVRGWWVPAAALSSHLEAARRNRPSPRQ